MRWLLLALTLGCAPAHKGKDTTPSDLASRVQARKAAWLLELKTSATDQATGWPAASDCDQTLFAGEARAAGAAIDLRLAEYNSGEIHRRPLSLGECYPTESASTVSNDMLVGYILGSWEARDDGALARLAEYGEVHNWVMGAPLSEPRVVLSPSGQGLLGRAIEKLGGPAKSYSILPQACLPVAADYEQHLQTLGIILGGQISGGISSLCLDMLKANAEGSPKDALFQAAFGVYNADQGPALSLLSEDGYQCPSYVRPAASYCLVHRLFAATTALRGLSESTP